MPDTPNADYAPLIRCPYRFVPGHLVEPERMVSRRCTRSRFHLGNHAVAGLSLGRWWLWQHPEVRLRNLVGRVRVVAWRLRHRAQIDGSGTAGPEVPGA